MGRYYYSQRFSGKFGFGVQNSHDPEIFGMESNPLVIEYYLSESEETKKHIMDVLNKNFKILNIEKKDRKFIFDNDHEIENYLDDVYYRRGRNKKATDEQYLAACRISLGLKILNDLRIDGFCSLDAEA